MYPDLFTDKMIHLLPNNVGGRREDVGGSWMQNGKIGEGINETKMVEMVESR